MSLAALRAPRQCGYAARMPCVARRRRGYAAQNRGSSTLQALLFAALFLTALAYVSMTDVRAGVTAAGDGRRGSRTLGLRMLSSLGVVGTVARRQERRTLPVCARSEAPPMSQYPRHYSVFLCFVVGMLEAAHRSPAMVDQGDVEKWCCCFAASERRFLMRRLTRVESFCCPWPRLSLASGPACVLVLACDQPRPVQQAGILLDVPETRPGFYAANLTASGRLPDRPRPSMVLRYEACGGLFNQVRGMASFQASLSLSHESRANT